MPSIAGRSGRHGLLVFMTVLATLLLPGRASATVYTWARNNNGDWTNPANWFCDGTTGSCANGFPNGRGDQANFTGDLGNIFIALKHGHKRSLFDIQGDLRGKLRNIPGVRPQIMGQSSIFGGRTILPGLNSPCGSNLSFTASKARTMRGPNIAS